MSQLTSVAAQSNETLEANAAEGRQSMVKTLGSLENLENRQTQFVADANEFHCASSKVNRMFHFVAVKVKYCWLFADVG